MFYVNGVTLLATNDNMLFPFSTMTLLEYPMNIFLEKVLGFSVFDGMKVMKVDVSSLALQMLMFNITGFALSPLCYYQESTNHDTVESPNNSSESTSERVWVDDEEMKELLDELMKDDIDNESVRQRMEQQVEIKNEQYDIANFLNTDENFVEFDAFVSTHFST